MSLSGPVEEFDGLLNRLENREMIAFLKRYQPSAHADIVDLLIKSAEGLSDIHFYCPDTDNHAYYIVHTSEGVMFAAAIGMSGLMYKLPEQGIKDALVKGGEIIAELGESWVSFDPFWPEENRENFSIKNMKHWCKLAFDASK
ncbi:MAG: hypothetical protein OEZ38_01945 [Gammaproteobacteria bacterium]|nr:hypothetical protein [Gammaproteobacteria bacterium]